VNSQLDDVNELLKLKQGDLVRLMHIKKTLESRNMLYISDSKYLQELTKAYLEDHTGERFSKYNSYDYPEYSNKLKDKTPSEPTKPVKETKTQSDKNSFCGNCGNSIDNENFCPKCGHSLNSKKNKTKELEPEKPESQSKPEEPVFVEKKNVQKNKGTKIGKIPIIILGVLAIVIIAGAAAMNSDMISMNIGGNEKSSVTDESKIITIDSQSTSDSNSKCGAGTVFDDKTNSCVLLGTISTEDEPNSKCGAGTVFDDKTNSCILDGPQSDSNSKCGPGTVFDDATNSCVLG
jgi:hypothetical protein